MKFCSFIKADGNQCRAMAVRSDPEGRCIFHSPRQSEAARKVHVVTASELLATIGREIRRLRNNKDLDPLARAAEVRNLIAMWKTLKGFEMPSPSADSSTELEKQLAKWKSQQ